MERPIVIRGTLRGPTEIVLDEPIDASEGPVEVVVLSLASGSASEDVFDFISGLPPGTRSKAGVDRAIDKERESWNGR